MSNFLHKNILEIWKKKKQVGTNSDPLATNSDPLATNSGSGTNSWFEQLAYTGIAWKCFEMDIQVIDQYVCVG